MPDNGITVEQIQIKINQESTNALKGIESLATALQGLKTVTTGGIRGLTTIANQLNKLNNAISAILDLSRLEQLNNVLTKLKDVGEINIRQTVSTLGSGKTVSQLEQLNEEAEKVMHGVGERVEEALDETKDAFSDTGGAEAFSEVNDTVDVTVDKIENLNALISLQKEKIIELQDSLDDLMSDDDADDSKILNLETQIERAKKSLLSLENELTKALTSANVYSEGGITDAVTERFTGLSERFATLKQELDVGVEKLNTALSEKTAYSDTTAFTNASTFADNLSLKIENLNYQMAELQSQFTQMKAAETPPSEGEWASFENRVRSVVMQMRSLKGQCDKTTDAVNKIGEAAEDAEKKGTSFASNFAASLKRIALYRIVRALLKQAANAISDGIENYAQYSEEANETISELKSVWQQFSSSLGVTVTQLLTGVLPILQSICNVLIDVVNAVNYFIALISGKSSYSKAIKQNLDYADSLESVQNSLLGIDEINKLSDNDSVDYSSMFEEVDLTAGDTIANILEIVAAITTVLTLLYALKGVNVFSALTTGAKNLISTLKNMSTVAKAATTIAALAAEVYLCYENFYAAFTGTESWEDALTVIIPVVTIATTVLTAMYGPVGLIASALAVIVSATTAYRKALDKLIKTAANDTFWAAMESYAVTLDELSDYMEENYSWTVDLADATEEWVNTILELENEIGDCIPVINSYMTKLKESGQLTEDEAESMLQAVSTMVSDMQEIMDTSMTGVWNTFSQLFSDASDEFLESLGDMKTEFLEFSSLFDSVTGDYESKIEALINKSITTGLTDEEVELLDDYVNALTVLSNTSSGEKLQYESLLEEALLGGVNFSDTTELTEFLSELDSTVDTYKSSLYDSYWESYKAITNYKEQAQGLYDLGLISESDYNSYMATFDEALSTLTTGYENQLENIDSDVDEIIQAIYQSIEDSLYSAYDAAESKWDSMSGWDKFWSSYDSGEEAGAYAMADLYKSMLSSLQGVDLDNIDIDLSSFSDWYESLLNYMLTHSFSYDGYATGGLPDSGELFMARENGIPEMVGSWGSNHSAVANNEQIVEGIKQGVYEAMVEAGSAGGDGGNITVQFVSSGQVKSEQIITAAERRNRRDGKKVIAVEV